MNINIDQKQAAKALFRQFWGEHVRAFDRCIREGLAAAGRPVGESNPLLVDAEARARRKFLGAQPADRDSFFRVASEACEAVVRQQTRQPGESFVAAAVAAEQARDRKYGSETWAEANLKLLLAFRADDLDLGSKFGGLITTAANNVHIDHLRKKERRREQALGDVGEAETPDHRDESPSAPLAQQEGAAEARERVAQFLKELSPRQREVVSARLSNPDASWEEIAEGLKMSSGAARQAYSLATKRLVEQAAEGP